MSELQQVSDDYAFEQIIVATDKPRVARHCEISKGSKGF